MKPKKFYKYHAKSEETGYSKRFEEDLLEKYLRKKRRKTTNTANRKHVSTVFKSIGYRKRHDSLKDTFKYLLKNTDTLINHMGSEIKLSDIYQEIENWNLEADQNNIKNINDKYNPNLKDEDLKHRQIWHGMFSLPNNKETNKEQFIQAIQEGVNELFKGHKTVVACHSNTNNMHCHIVVKMKNEITGRRLRINPLELKEIHNKLQQKCIEKEVEFDHYKKPRLFEAKYNKKEVIDRGKKYNLTSMYNKVPKWKAIYDKKGEFAEIKISEANTKRLAKLGMDDKSINSFLHMYKENPSIAEWSVNKYNKLFNIEKPSRKFEVKKLGLEKDNPELARLKKPKKYRLSKSYDKVPIWKEIYEKGEAFPSISVSEAHYNNLKNLGMDEHNINSFLNLYKEDKNLAVWTINSKKFSKVFNIEKPATPFNVRKLTLDIEDTKENKNNQVNTQLDETKEHDR